MTLAHPYPNFTTNRFSSGLSQSIWHRLCGMNSLDVGTLIKGLVVYSRDMSPGTFIAEVDSCITTRDAGMTACVGVTAATSRVVTEHCDSHGSGGPASLGTMPSTPRTGLALGRINSAQMLVAELNGSRDTVRGIAVAAFESPDQEALPCLFAAVAERFAFEMHSYLACRGEL